MSDKLNFQFSLQKVKVSENSKGFRYFGKLKNLKEALAAQQDIDRSSEITISEDLESKCFIHASISSN